MCKCSYDTLSSSGASSAAGGSRGSLGGEDSEYERTAGQAGQAGQEGASLEKTWQAIESGFVSNIFIGLVAFNHRARGAAGLSVTQHSRVSHARTPPRTGMRLR